MSRVGTSAIALAATSFKKPVLFFAETYKFSEKVHLNSISYNEIADPVKFSFASFLRSETVFRMILFCRARTVLMGPGSQMFVVTGETIRF